MVDSYGEQLRTINYPTSNSFRGTRRGTPASRARQLLEIRRRDVGSGEVDGILHLRGDRQPRVAVGYRVEVVIFGDDGLVAVRRTVLAHVAGAQVGGHDLEVSGAGSTPTAAARREFPLRDGLSLPARSGVCRGCCGARAEMQEPRLRAGVRVDLQRVRVAPGDVNAPWQP